ncbi:MULTISPECIES: TIGR02922 family protein [Shewanella]|nr:MULTISPECIES: TIGR02922 family protein [Shewanella]AYV11444.1 TIGR02922 family protein [Shewanella algae]QXN27401.1 TIGR02922 family protein [Shewanella putrefaciens]
MKIACVTVLFYSSVDSVLLESRVLNDCNVGEGGRVILPNAFKQDKMIIAVLSGNVTVLNRLGDRIYTEPKLLVNN